MSSNYYASGVEYEEITFDRPVNYINIFVSTGNTASLSVDRGQNFITITAGFHSFAIGSVDEIVVSGTGAWQILAVQG